MTELAMLADIQLTVYPDELTRRLHVMVQARESSTVIDRCSTTVLRHQLIGLYALILSDFIVYLILLYFVLCIVHVLCTVYI